MLGRRGFGGFLEDGDGKEMLEFNLTHTWRYLI